MTGHSEEKKIEGATNGGRVPQEELSGPEQVIEQHRRIAKLISESKDPYNTFNVETAMAILVETRRFIKEAFKKGVDYEVRKRAGQQEESLLKPGAEKLALKFKLRPEFHLQDPPTLDWDRQLFHFTFICKLIHIPTGAEVAQYVASCNSWEEKYRYRWLGEKFLPSGVDKDNLPSKQKESSYGKFTVYRLDNPYVADQINTVVQMAQKRAFVGCVRVATQTSDRFTQDEGGGNGPGALEGAPTGKSRDTTKKKESPEVQKLKDDLYVHFAGDEEAVQEFLQKILSASGKIPLEKLPATKLDKIVKALEEKKGTKKKDDDALPF